MSLLLASLLRGPAWAWCYALAALVLPACLLFWLADQVDPPAIDLSGPPA